MKLIQELYNNKKREAKEAIKLIKDGDSISVPLGVGEPPTILSALSEHRREYHDVKVMQLLPCRKYSYFDPETAEHVRHVAYFLSGTSRKGAKEGWIDVIPTNFYGIPKLIEDGYVKADVAVTMVSRMDKQGFFSVSLATDYTMAAIANAREVIVEVNPNVPYAYGNNKVHISQVSALVESQDPIFVIGLPTIGPVHKAIAENVAPLIKDGSTLQIGLGAIPDAVIMQLQNKHDLGIHTELVTDALLYLYETGAITCQKKNYLSGKIIATVALGSQKLYDFMDHNPMLEMHPVNFTNDPALAGLNNNLVCVNGSLEVDFSGQCNSESIGPVPFSGTGGQGDFAQAASRSKGGKSIIVLPSTAANGTISRIVPTLTPGSVVSTTKNDVNYVVTEYGVAQLRGKSLRQRMEELIAIAHPDFRGDLRKAARRMNFASIHHALSSSQERAI